MTTTDRMTGAEFAARAMALATARGLDMRAGRWRAKIGLRFP